MEFYTWYDILRWLDPADLKSTTPRCLLGALLAVEARDWELVGTLANLLCDVSQGRSLDRSHDRRAYAIASILHGVAYFERGDFRGATDNLATATTILHRFPQPSDRLNEAIGRLAWSIVLANSRRCSPARIGDTRAKTEAVRSGAIQLAHEASDLAFMASTYYAAKGDLERWRAVKGMSDWIDERLKARLPVKIVVQV